MENGSDAALGVLQTYNKIAKVFGEQVKESVCVIIAHAAAANNRGPYLITERVAKCEEFNIPCMVWESKDISAEDKLNNVKEFFKMVSEDLKPYPILRLNNLDDELRISARNLQLNPTYRERTLRKDKRGEVIDFKKLGSQYQVTIKMGERWPAGKGYGTALKNAYVVRIGDNIKLFLKSESSGKYIAIPLYLIYIGVFTIVPLYPVLGTLDEAKKLMEPIVSDPYIVPE